MFGIFRKGQLNTLNPAEVKGLQAEGKIHLVDVREDNEWLQGRIPGALHAPLSRLAQLAPDLPTDKPVVFYCAGGVRSAKAVDLCRQLGVAHETHMAGGIGNWMAHGHDVER